VKGKHLCKRDINRQKYGEYFEHANGNSYDLFSKLWRSRGPDMTGKITSKIFVSKSVEKDTTYIHTYMHTYTHTHTHSHSR
jgi:hypothetical protein